MRTALKQPRLVVRPLTAFAVVGEYASAAKDIREPLSRAVEVFERLVLPFFLRLLVLLVRRRVAIAAKRVEQVQAELEWEVELPSILALAQLLLQLLFC